MRIKGRYYRTIWEKAESNKVVRIIDQRHLPFLLEIEDLVTLNNFYFAMRDMHLRGAPLLGAAAGYAMYFSCLESRMVINPNKYINRVARLLVSARPTAVNLSWAVNKQLNSILPLNNIDDKIDTALLIAREIVEEDIAHCRKIGEYGSELIEKIAVDKHGEPVNILTHCNAGWLATIDYGTATAPIYLAAEKGINVHVWVDETRPRNQGSKLTSFELNEEGIPNTIIVDNAGGHLMQHGFVDIVIVGCDRATCTGDIANKTGTYLKALAAYDNAIPFYVALPSSSIDWSISDGLAEIPIEERDSDEVLYIDGLCKGEIKKVRIAPEKSKASNFAFDVTPSRLVTGLITEKGICRATTEGIIELFGKSRK